MIAHNLNLLTAVTIFHLSSSKSGTASCKNKTHMNQPIATEKTNHFPDQWTRCDGLQWRQLLQAGLVSLEAHYPTINLLNVFPIPDGDTGTNMLNTLRKASEAIADDPNPHIGQVAEQYAAGARKGARGNSGVILSEIFQGIAHELGYRQTASVTAFVKAFRTAVSHAYASVSEPTEGTILSVITRVAEAAEVAAGQDVALRPFFRHIAEEAQDALLKTPEQLPILKQAGVVDSGGQGLVTILQSFVNVLEGVPVTDVTLNGSSLPSHIDSLGGSRELEYPYDVQFLLHGHNLDVAQVRSHVETMGDCTVIGGDSSLIKVHVHVKNPGEPLTYGASLGVISDVVVENMQRQMQQIVTQASGDPLPLPNDAISADQIGVVAVVSGTGFDAIFRSMRAAQTVYGGQTHNPSVEMLVTAVDSIPSRRVILLPNNKNIILAAQKAAQQSKKEVIVVPTHSAPQGLAAMLMLNLDGELADTAIAMEMASTDIITAAITTSTRTVTLNGLAVQEGETIGLLDGRLCAAGESVTVVLLNLLAHLEMEQHEIITLYRGIDMPSDDAELLQQTVASHFPEHVVELHDGFQPHYDVVIGIE